MVSAWEQGREAAGTPRGSTSVPPVHWARTVDGACIAYQDIGEGPATLVVVHGWVSHLEVYWEQPRYVRFVQRLARHMRVLLFDKRGIGMSDRVSGTPDLGVLLDDVRAVMDAAGVERAALLAWGSPGPALAAFFAAACPERTLCLVLDGDIHIRRESDYPWGITRDELDDTAKLADWGDESGARAFVEAGYECKWESQYVPIDDPDFLRWNAKLARNAATPASYEAFEQMWFDTDARHVLPAIHVPTAVLSRENDRESWRACTEYVLGAISGAVALELPAHPSVVWLGEPEGYVAPIERWVQSVLHEEADLDRVLATVLFTDVVGSTAKAVELGDARWREVLESQNSAVRAMLARYRGNEVKTMGDGFLATFDGPARAVRCAQAICAAVEPLGLQVRAGCHTGEIELMGEGGADVGGIAVHIGARIGTLAGPSEVLVSSTVKDLVAGSGLAFEDRGERELKGVPGSWRLYAAVASRAGLTPGPSFGEGA